MINTDEIKKAGLKYSAPIAIWKYPTEKNVFLYGFDKGAEWMKSELLREHESWPLKDILERLLFATDFLLHNKNYDRIGWEDIQHCLELGRNYLESIEPTENDRV